jgi:molybdopterin-guanine dinucleotide biosynthesis protein A
MIARASIMGAIIAGGRSQRFGRDKAFAALDGRPLLDHVAEALAVQTGALVVVGREWPCFRSIPDRPHPDQGPLGGLCAALHHARTRGFAAVLTAGCDILPIPGDLADLLGPPNAVVDGQPLLGLWDSGLADRLDAHLAGEDRSIRGWIAASGAQRVTLSVPLHNFNTRDDLVAYSQEQAA